MPAEFYHWEFWFTLAVVLSLLVLLIFDLFPPDMLFLGATGVLALSGVISPGEAFSGFSNSGMLTVGVLFVVAAGLRETGLLDYIGQKILGSTETENMALFRLAVVVIPLSAFLNNTPLVAMLVPVVLDWCRRQQISPSKLLIPLSYLAILGGVCSLIGTSTNLVVNGLIIARMGEAQGMGLFEITAIGLPVAVLGVAYLYFFGQKLLPERKELIEQLGEARREYLVEMLVQPGCRLIGQSISSAGLRKLPGLFLIEIDRDGQIIGPVSPEDVIQVNDRLIFTGVVGSIIDLEKIPGLVPASDPTYEVVPRKQRKRRLCEAVISPDSPLIGKTIRDADFRATYGVAVVAVHRSGTRMKGKIGDVVVRPGDTLLLQTRPHFERAYRNDPAFYLVSNVEDYRPLRRDRAWIAGILFVLLLFFMTTGVVDLLVGVTMVAVVMVLTGCISSGEARRSVEWQVLITIAAAFGVGIALDRSGAARVLAGSIVNLTYNCGDYWGPLVALATIYLLAALITELITNNAAAVLMFPFCIQTAELYEVSPRPFLMALVIAASASFMTPIGYQTNMMVYGPGGYRYADFFRIGAPLSLTIWILVVLFIPLIWHF